mgnify:CR=1 FL=1
MNKKKQWTRQNWFYYLTVLSFKIQLENSLEKTKVSFFTWRILTSGFIVDQGISSINAFADLFADNSGIFRLSRDPLLTNKILKQMNFDTWYIIIMVNSNKMPASRSLRIYLFIVWCVQVQWFWRALRSFDQTERANVLQFVTGSSKVPLQGFAALEGMNGPQKFQIHRDDRSTDRLPCAHTW